MPQILDSHLAAVLKRTSLEGVCPISIPITRRGEKVKGIGP